MSRVGWSLLVGAGVLLAGCAAPPVGPLPAEPAPAVDKGSPVALFERQTRERALLATRQGRLGEAAQAWDVLLALRPDAREAREARAELQRRIDAAVADRSQRAQRAQQRGELDAATQLYLAVLALQPEHAQAAEALRALERERVRRQQLGRPSRLALTRRAQAEAEMAAPAAAHIELEHAALLAGQGEIDGAIALLEPRVAAEPRADAARAALADLYQRKAEQALAARDTLAATTWLEKSLRLDPGDAKAADQLRQLRAAARR